MAIITYIYDAGHFVFDTNTSTLKTSRMYGVYSNINCIIHAICAIKRDGYDVKRISISLDHYIINYNVYDDLFCYKPIRGEVITKEQAETVLGLVSPTCYGLSKIGRNSISLIFM